MGLFSNYEHLNVDYYPNNLIRKMPLPQVQYQYKLPRKEFNLSGKFVGYSWDCGDTLTLDIDINPIVKVASDALIYTQHDESPTSDTQGHLGQMAYNTYDLKCWCCISQNDQSVFVWEEEDVDTIPIVCGEKGTEDIRLQVYKDISNYIGKAILCNFRYEPIMDFDVVGADTISIEITEEITAKLVRGIYYLYFDLGNTNGDRQVVYLNVPLIIQ